MANDQLFIPQKIKVGFQWRNDTYTGKLAYVTYFDVKGKLCKEKSWKGWIKDKDYDSYEYRNGKHEKIVMPGIPAEEFENKPMEGFVLNKKVGGYNTGWNHRQVKCRVYDPRGFEFEIGMENLLFILQEASSFKGKGLEGEFVYSWQGSDLILLPCSGTDYKSSQEFTDLKTMSVHAKTLVAGRTYYTKDQEKVVYMGKYDHISSATSYSNYGAMKITKEFMFLAEKQVKNTNVFKPLKVNKLAKVTSEACVDGFADFVTELEASGLVMPVAEIVMDTLKDSSSLVKAISEHDYYQRDLGRFLLKIGDNKYHLYHLYRNTKYEYDPLPEGKHSYQRNGRYVFSNFSLHSQNQEIEILNNNHMSVTDLKEKAKGNNTYSPEELNHIGLVSMKLKFLNGKTKTI